MENARQVYARMVMKKMIRISLPIYASAIFEFEKPENWDELTQEEKVELFFQDFESSGSLCNQCTANTETDYEVDDRCLEDWNDDDYYFVEE
jgi:hypothetical protein